MGKKKSSKRSPGGEPSTFRGHFKEDAKNWEEKTEKNIRKKKAAEQKMSFSDEESEEMMEQYKKNKASGGRTMHFSGEESEAMMEEHMKKKKKSIDRKPLGVESKEERSKKLYEAAKRKRKGMTADQLKAKIEKDANKSRTIRRGMEEQAYESGKKSPGAAYESDEPGKYKRGKKRVEHVLKSRDKWDETKKRQDKEWDEKTGKTPGGLRFMRKVKKKLENRKP